MPRAPSLPQLPPQPTVKRRSLDYKSSQGQGAETESNLGRSSATESNDDKGRSPERFLTGLPKSCPAKSRGRRSKRVTGPKTIDLDDDEMFSFICDLPVYKQVFDKQLLLNTSDFPSHERVVLRSAAIGKSFHPVCTIVRKNADTGSIEELCHFAKPLDSDKSLNYIVGFQATSQRTAEFATLIWLVISTFGLVSRKAVSLRWMSTPTLDAIHSLPTLKFVNALNYGIEGLHGFVSVTTAGSPKYRKVLTRVAVRKYKIFCSEEQAEAFLRLTDQSFLVGVAHKHVFENSPYFNDPLREFLKIPSNRKDAASVYNYVHLQNMWATPNAETSSIQLEDILQPSTRRAWPVKGFIPDPDDVADS